MGSATTSWAAWLGPGILPNPFFCCPSMPLDMWKISSPFSHTAGHLSVMLKAYNAQILIYDTVKKLIRFLQPEEREVAPVFSPILSEILQFPLISTGSAIVEKSIVPDNEEKAQISIRIKHITNILNII
eukprot:TRINITY_DN13686_c0_g1_i1.p1 TRINITY_DN13686_c0_g1~~TRINITY_DN13686_c0_g1_i1.p1  ORF type:complete len:129 (-),score=17.11 TRINITY_DN13686_c0_g1_i1:161-547(-)